MSILYDAIDDRVEFNVACCAEHGFHRHTAWTDCKVNLGHLRKNWIVGPSLLPELQRRLIFIHITR